jgi:hypothetical protein
VTTVLVDIGSMVRVSYAVQGLPAGITFTVVDKDACHWILVPNITWDGPRLRIPFNCVRPFDVEQNYRD